MSGKISFWAYLSLKKAKCLDIVVLKAFKKLTERPGPEVILTSFATQLSMKFFLLINVKMPTIVGI